MSDGRTAHDSVRMMDGAVAAAFLAAGIGTFALGLIVILNESGIFAAPALYAPAGGVSGRTTIAALVWLAAWALLHRSWRERQVGVDRVVAGAIALTLLGIALLLPPLWTLF